jgi:hypothetical protein
MKRLGKGPASSRPKKITIQGQMNGSSLVEHAYQYTSAKAAGNPLMVPSYKFLNSNFVDQILSGEIRFSKLSLFRKMEEDHAKWIADDMEYCTELQISHYHIDEATPEAIAKYNATFAPTGIPALFQPAPGAKNITIGGGGKIRFIGADDPYIFCCSQGNLNKLTKTMCESPVDPKDACVRIVNLRALAQRIVDKGRTRDLPEQSFQIKFRVDPIRYTKVSVKQGEPIELPTPFTKDIIFSGQREARIALLPMIDGDLPDVVTFRIPKPHQLIREEFRDYDQSWRLKRGIAEVPSDVGEVGDETPRP